MFHGSLELPEDRNKMRLHQLTNDFGFYISPGLRPMEMVGCVTSTDGIIEHISGEMLLRDHRGGHCSDGCDWGSSAIIMTLF